MSRTRLLAELPISVLRRVRGWYRNRRLLDVLADFVELSTGAGVDYWLGGGWAYEAYRGRVTREHRDIDVSIRAEDRDSLESALVQAGASVERCAGDWLDVTWQRVHIDIHMFRTEDGMRVQHLRNSVASFAPEVFEAFETRTLRGIELRVHSQSIFPAWLRNRTVRHHLDREFIDSIVVPDDLVIEMDDVPITMRVPRVRIRKT